MSEEVIGVINVVPGVEVGAEQVETGVGLPRDPEPKFGPLVHEDLDGHDSTALNGRLEPSVHRHGRCWWGASSPRCL